MAIKIASIIKRENLILKEELEVLNRRLEANPDIIFEDIPHVAVKYNATSNKYLKDKDKFEVMVMEMARYAEYLDTV